MVFSSILKMSCLVNIDEVLKFINSDVILVLNI